MNNKRSARRRPAGYSVIELLVVLAVAGVVVAMAGPALDRVVKDHRRSAVANELLRTVLLARSEAVKRGDAVVVCGLADANGNGMLDEHEGTCSGRNWSFGWLAAPWNDVNGNGTVDAGELGPALLHHVNDRAGITVRAGNFTALPPVAPAGTAVFKSLAQRSSNGTITVCDGRGAGEARGIVISPNGRSRISARKSGGDQLDCP
jgi:type IV fimbrial biogenesis protein FimT